jgi:hypothetical protein
LAKNQSGYFIVAPHKEKKNSITMSHSRRQEKHIEIKKSNNSIIRE